MFVFVSPVLTVIYLCPSWGTAITCYSHTTRQADELFIYPDPEFWEKLGQGPELGRTGLSLEEQLGEKLGKTWGKLGESLGTTFIWDRGLCVQTERVKFRIQIDQLWMSVELDP